MKPLLGCGIACLLVAVLAIAAAVFYFSRTPGNTVSAVERETDLENDLHLENEVQQPWDVRIDSEVVHLDFSLDGKRLAAACGDHVAVIDVDAKTILKRFDAPDIFDDPKESQTRKITSVAISPDGKTVFAGRAAPPHRMSLDTAAHLWDVESGKLLANIDCRTYKMIDAEFAPDGKTFAAVCAIEGGGSWGAEIFHLEIRNAITGALEQTLKIDKCFSGSLHFSGEGKYLSFGAVMGLTFTFDYFITTWDTKTWQKVPELSRSHEEMHFGDSSKPDRGYVALSSKGNYFVVPYDTRIRTGEGDNVKIFDQATLDVIDAKAREKKCTIALTGTHAQVFGLKCLLFSPNEKFLAASSFFLSYLLDVEAGEILCPIPGGAKCADFSPDSHLVAFGGADETHEKGLIRFYPIPSVKTIPKPPRPPRPPETPVIPQPPPVQIDWNGPSTFTNCPLWDSDDNNNPGNDNVRKKIGCRCEGWACSCLVDGKCTCPQCMCKNSEPPPKELPVGLRYNGERDKYSGENNERIVAIDFSADGNRVGIVRAEGVSIFDMQTGTIIREWKYPDSNESNPNEQYRRRKERPTYGRIFSAAISPDGKSIFVGYQTKTTRFWDVDTGEELFTMEHPNPITLADFAPDGRTIATNSGGLQVQATKSTNIIKTFPRDYYCAVQFSADGSRLFAALKGMECRAWDTKTWEEMPNFQRAYHQRYDNSVVFSQDGRFVASTNGEKLSIHETEKSPEKEAKKPLQNLELREVGKIYNMDFSPSGNMIALACKNGSYLFDVESGKILSPLVLSPNQETQYYAVAFSPVRRIVAVGGSNGEVRFYPVPTVKELAETQKTENDTEIKP